MGVLSYFLCGSRWTDGQATGVSYREAPRCLLPRSKVVFLISEYRQGFGTLSGFAVG